MPRSRAELKNHFTLIKVVGAAIAIGLHLAVLGAILSAPSVKPEMIPSESVDVRFVEIATDIVDAAPDAPATQPPQSTTEAQQAPEVIEPPVPEQHEPEPVPEDASEPESELTAESEAVEPAPAAEPEEVVPEAIHEPVVEPKVEPKPEPKPQPKPQPKKPETKPQPKPKPELKPAIKPAPKFKPIRPAPVAIAPVPSAPVTTAATAAGNTGATTVPRAPDRPVDPDRPRMIGKVDYMGKRPSPVYPRTSQRRGEQGRVVVRVLISAKGSVVTVSVRSSSGHSRLDEAALSAARGARFKPYMENGIAYQAMADIPFDFVL